MNLLACLLLSVIAYQSPVHYEISLAGNFGEPRPNHFHGGIDIKTGGIEGKPIFSIGDGYVSCVTVGVGGYGNAVYIRHPEGYTSVYAHLKKFAPQIEANVKQWQYAHQSTNATLVFPPTAIPVSKGQLIAVSGNSGASQAPHLHLEVHHTHSWDMMILWILSERKLKMLYLLWHMVLWSILLPEKEVSVAVPTSSLSLLRRII